MIYWGPRFILKVVMETSPVDLNLPNPVTLYYRVTSNIELFLLLRYYCNFASVMNCKSLICRISHM